MIPSKPFLFYLTNTYTGLAYVMNSAGIISQVNIITAGYPTDLENAPADWINTTMGFDRSEKYFGLNRAYATGQEFVRNVRLMYQRLILEGYGTEEEISLTVLKYNSDPQPGEPIYLLYFKAPLDIPETEAVMLESISCNLMEGGVAQLLRNYGDTVLEIPCDGSLPEHIKANYDGLLVQDKLFYQFVPIENNLTYSILPVVYLNNEAENFGIVTGSPTQEDVFPAGDVSGSSNYVFYSRSLITVRVFGEIIIQDKTTDDISLYSIYLKTDRGQIIFFTPFPNSYPVLGNTTARFSFDISITLQPDEKLYIIDQIVLGGIHGVSGNFTISFVSKPKDSRAWGMTAYDLYQKIGEQIKLRAATNGQVLNYSFTSALLQQRLDFFLTCGDALRASNDPSYQNFYSVGENNITQFGPVFKITLNQFYESLRVPLTGAMGRSPANELFFEHLDYVFNDSVVNYDVGEVARLKWKFSKKHRFSDLNIGYPPQTYDQKAGKFEYNTTLKMKAPVISFEQVLDLISYIRWDSYGIERVRAAKESGASTSTTRNDSDNSVFGTVINRDSFIYDYFRAQFISLVSNPDNPDNTNILFKTEQLYQKYDHPVTDGDYFKTSKDFGIFVFSEDGYSATESTTISIAGIVNSVNRPPSAPVDFIKIRYWRNGVILKEYLTTVTGINTPINNVETFPQLYAVSDCIYITMETSVTAEATINTASITIGSYVSMSGANTPVLSGTSQQVLSLPSVVPTSDPYGPTSVVQYGYQYFTYNSLAYANNFDMQLGILGYKEGTAPSGFVFNIYVNGVQIPNYIVVTGSVPRLQFALQGAIINRNFQLNDIVFVTGGTTSMQEVQIDTSTLTFTNTFVKAYALYRIQYDNLGGLPILTRDALGNFRTDVPGAPYNIEYVSPARCRDAWIKYFNSCFVDNVVRDMLFQSLNKNPYLSTTVNNVTIKENADKPLLINGRYFYPVEVEFEFKCPLTFDQIQSQLANAYVGFKFGGEQFYIHVLHVEQKPALNEVTVLRGLLGASTNLSIFARLTGFKIEI